MLAADFYQRGSVYEGNVSWTPSAQELHVSGSYQLGQLYLIHQKVRMTLFRLLQKWSQGGRPSRGPPTGIRPCIQGLNLEHGVGWWCATRSRARTRGIARCIHHKTMPAKSGKRRQKAAKGGKVRRLTTPYRKPRPYRFWFSSLTLVLTRHTCGCSVPITLRRLSRV